MTTTTTIPSNYDQNQVNIVSHSNNNNKANHINNYQPNNPELINTNVLLTNNHNPNSIVNGYIYNPGYVFGGGTPAAPAAGEV